MGGLRDFLGGHQVISFVVFTFVFSWYFWGAAASMPESREAYLAIGRFGPTIVGLTLLLLFKGLDGVRGLLAKVGDRSANPLFYVFALFGAALTVVPAVYAGAQLSGTGANWIDPSQWYTILVNFGYFLVFGALGGELGWRGFALPRLQRDAVAFVSGLVLGLVWGLWQAPLWYMEGRLVSVYFLLFLLQAMGFSVLYTWLYNNTDGNLLIIGLFHAASGTTLYALPVLPTATGGDTTPMLISLGLLWVMVAAVTVVYGPTYLSRKKKYTIFGEFSWEYED